MRHTRVLGAGHPNQCLPNFLKMLLLALPQIYTRVFHFVENYRFAQCLGWRFSPISTFFSLVSSRAFRDAPHSRFQVSGSQTMLTGLFKDARFGPFSNLHTCISLVEVYRFAQCLGWSILTHLYFLSLACFRAFTDAPHSRFRCRHCKLCLPDFLKMLDLALSQIYTRVFHLWKSIDLDSVWVGDSRPYQLSFFRKFSRV